MSVQSLPVPSNPVSRGCVMLKIVYRVCCGMDVHKSFIVACIASTNEQGVTTYKSKRFSTVPHYMVCDSNTTEQRHGLGLLIVKQVAASHKGTTTIGHSRHGGFAVDITLPIIC